MDHRHELAVAVGGEFDTMSRFGPVSGDCEALIACRDQLHGPVEPTRRDRDQCSALGQRASRAEGATDERRNDADPFGVDPELLGETVLDASHILAALPDRQLAIGPGTARREQFDRVVVLGRRRIVLIYCDRRARKGGRGIADRWVFVIARYILSGYRGDAGTVETRRRSLRGVGDLEPMRGLPRCLESLGEDHGDDLTVMPDLVRGQRHDRRADIAAVAEQFGRLDRVADVAVGQDVQHAGNGAASGLVDVGDPAARDRARREKRISRVGERCVGGVAGFAGDLQAAIDARRGSPDFAVSSMIRRLVGRLAARHGPGSVYPARV
jgi:hypothetical protein